MAETLGETFKERRKQLGISLPQAEEQLHIRARLLEALEEGDYERLPNPGYVRGYISTYAKYLELDPKPLLDMYQAETGHGRIHRIELPEQAVKPRHEQHALSWRAALAAVAVIALVSLAIWAAVAAFRGPETPVPIAPEPTSTGSSGATSSAGSTGTATQSVHPTPTAPAKPKIQAFVLKIEVADGEQSWLRIKVDGATKFADVASGPDVKQYRVKKSADVQIGRPSVVTVFADGKEVAVTERNGIGQVSLEATPSTQ